MGRGPHILVADDEPNLRRVLAAILAREGYQVVQAADGAEALELVAKNSFSVVITDLKMPRVDGMTVLRRIAETQPQIPVIMITAFGSVDNAVAAVKAGAFDYIEKPFEQEQIRQIIEKAVKQSAHQDVPNAATLDPELEATVAGRFGLIGASKEMHSIFEIVEKVADTPSTVLITGESGTGKELVAKALHENSIRSNDPFIKINCAAIPKNLMESELFGYEKGAFTGATSSKPGRFELADGGTLFLDEIGEIPIEMQVKLLRAIQEQEFERVGGLKTLKVDVRLITATNRDLKRETEQGNFREDLYYRLNVVPINIPPLRERGEDTVLLVNHIIGKFNTKLQKDIEGISDDAMDRLRSHAWPGNIRELENVLERTIIFCTGPTIELGDLPEEWQPTAKGSDAVIPATDGHPATTSLKDAVRAETSRIEKELISRALEETSGNVTKAAKLLQISRKSLQMKMKDFGLRDAES